MTGFARVSPHEIAVANDEVFVVGNTIGLGGTSVFPANANGDVAPSRSIETDLLASQEPAALAVSIRHALRVEHVSNSVLAFPATGSGAISPVRAIYGAAITLEAPRSIVVVP